MPAAFGLGTVQFGQAYGISNARGQVRPDEVAAILDAAADAGCAVLDTAALYGDSEGVLGRCPAVRRFRVVSKTVQFRTGSIGPTEAAALRAGIESSLTRLRLERVHGLMIHHADDLLVPGGERLWAVLQQARAEGLAGRIGASVYDASQIARLLDRYPLEIVQVPLNVLDQRLIASGQLENLQRRGIEVHARSVFLQGLLLMPPEMVHPRFAPVQPLLRAFHAAAAERGLTPLQAAMAFVRDRAELSAIVVGVTCVDELDQCLAAYREAVSFDAARFACADERYVNPARWTMQ